MKTRKAQEEIVGFVMVILLVSLIFLIFLGIYLRKGNAEPTSSIEVSQFLNSLVEYTSDCSLDSGFSYKQIDDLAVKCDEGALCSSGKTACQVLDDTIKKIIESSWNFSPDSPEKGYIFMADFPLAPQMKIPPTPPTPPCTVRRGADKPFSGVTFTLEICLN